ncbi:MAG: SH3 domain-containing protein [Pseudomonadota bacterium]
MKRAHFFAVVLSCLTVTALAGEPARLTVVDPFIELHSGAGRGYPVLEVVGHGSDIEVIERRTTWYRVRTARGTEGWAPREQLLRTLTPGGETFREQEKTADDFRAHRFEAGTWLGDFDGGALLGLSGGWRFTPNLSTELAVHQVVGRVADSRVLDLSLAAHPFPDWRYAPWLAIGTGLVQTQPSSVLVSAERREDQSLSVATGVERWLSQTFVLRAEYRNYLVLTSRETHESMDTWKVGLTVFF